MQDEGDAKDHDAKKPRIAVGEKEWGSENRGAEPEPHLSTSDDK